jgi:hypothetical protein
MSQIQQQRSEPGIPERALLCILGTTRHLLGRAERSIPRSPQRARLWRAGVDGESARRAIMARPWMAPLASLEKRKDFATLRQPIRHEVVTHVSGTFWGAPRGSGPYTSIVGGRGGIGTIFDISKG